MVSPSSTPWLTMVDFIERHAEKIAGVLSCFDRVVLTGTLPDICHAEAATRYLFDHKIRIFDYTQFAEPLRDQIRNHTEKLAADQGLTIEFLRNRDVRKEDRIQEILEQRGRHPGLVHIFSAMEPCPSFQPWHDKASGKTFLRYKDGKCLHYYFYFIDPMLGLCYLRVPTWAPFRLQFYFNGHNLLAHKLDLEGIAFGTERKPVPRFGVGVLIHRIHRFPSPPGRWAACLVGTAAAGLT